MSSKDADAAKARLRIELGLEQAKRKAAEKAERQLRQIAAQRKKEGK